MSLPSFRAPRSVRSRKKNFLDSCGSLVRKRQQSEGRARGNCAGQATLISVTLLPRWRARESLDRRVQRPCHGGGDGRIWPQRITNPSLKVKMACRLNAATAFLASQATAKLVCALLAARPVFTMNFIDALAAYSQGSGGIKFPPNACRCQPGDSGAKGEATRVFLKHADIVPFRFGQFPAARQRRLHCRATTTASAACQTRATLRLAGHLLG